MAIDTTTEVVIDSFLLLKKRIPKHSKKVRSVKKRMDKFYFFARYCTMLMNTLFLTDTFESGMEYDFLIFCIYIHAQGQVFHFLYFPNTEKATVIHCTEITTGFLIYVLLFRYPYIFFLCMLQPVLFCQCLLMASQQEHRHVRMGLILLENMIQVCMERFLYAHNRLEPFLSCCLSVPLVSMLILSKT